MADADLLAQPRWVYRPNPEDSPEIKEASEHASKDIPLELNQEISVKCLLFENNQVTSNTECQLVVDVQGYCMQINGKTIRKIRYVGVRRYESFGHVCVLSWTDLSWQNEDDPSQMYLFFQVPEEGRLHNSLKVLNSIKHLQFEQVISACEDRSIEKKAMEAVNFNRLLLMGDLPCSIDEAEQKDYFCVMDRESLCLFPYKFAEQPIRKLFFWKEEGPNVVEQVMMIHGTQSIKIECPNTKLTILNSDTGIVKEFVSLLKKVVNSKPRTVFQDYKELYHLLQNEKANTRQGFGTPVFHKEKNVSWLSQNAGKQEDAWASAANYSLHDDAQTYKTELDTAEEKCKRMPVYEDMIAPMWIAAEEEMRGLLESSFVPRSEFDSGGFDPNNFEHLQKCLQDAEEKLMEQSYDLALSRILGARKTFAASDSEKIRDIFKDDDMTLLKKIYLRNFSLSQ